MMRSNYLFAGPDWFSVETNQKERLRSEVSELDGNRLLNTSVDDLSRYLEQKYRIEVPTLLKNNIEVDQCETQIDVRHDGSRMIHDRSRPFYITGTEVIVEIPFTGDSGVFGIRPSVFSMNPLKAEIRDQTLVIHIVGIDLQSDAVKSEVERAVSTIESTLARLKGDAETLNRQLAGLARHAVEERRKKLLKDRNLVASLGFRIKERVDSRRTYTAPEVKRTLTPRLPSATAAPYRPEPTLSMDDYDHILDVLENMAHVMEWSPSAFETMDEESLRSHFLVQLNGHYEGQATGETFNYEGKTDILIRSKGRNIFIAECKLWSGRKKLLAAIDQLLSYSSWRDTKSAIILFNRNKDFSRVLGQIPEIVKSHENFKRDLGRNGESRFRFVFAHRDDPNRELFLVVLAFDVPSPAEQTREGEG